jgi:hypothetical protein
MVHPGLPKRESKKYQGRSGNLLFLHALEPVSDERTDNEDDGEDDDPDEDPDCAGKADTKTNKSWCKEEGDEPEDNPEDDTDDRPHLEEPPEIFLPFMEKPVRYTKDKNQQFKPHTISPDYQQYHVSSLKKVTEIRHSARQIMPLVAGNQRAGY